MVRFLINNLAAVTAGVAAAVFCGGNGCFKGGFLAVCFGVGEGVAGN